MRSFVLIVAAGALVGSAGIRAQAQIRGGGPPSISVRPADSRQIRTATAHLLGFQVAVPAIAFRQLTFSDAAAKVDALGLAFIEGFSTQKVSAGISKSLDYNLTAAELAAVKNRLAELRLKMAAYHADIVASDDGTRRKLFEFAKALGVETIVCAPEPASVPVLDKLASEYGINVALESRARDPKSVLSAIEGSNPRVGVSADLGAWLQAGVKPLDALSQLKGRLLVVNLRDRSATGAKGRNVTLGSGVAGVTQFLLEMARLLPAPQEFPEKCSNCGRPTGELKPVLLTVDTTDSEDTAADLGRSIEGYEKAVRPAMGYRVEQIARLLPITSPDRVPPADRQKIDAALPRQALVQPKKSRKLLVMDLCPAGGYYHTTIAYANLALGLMAKYTGAYEPVFSNDPENLKYPKIKRFDAVFLNSTVGEVFPDPEVLNGLMRFVREGGGLGGLHGASYASMDVPEFGEMIGAQDGPHHVEKAFLRIEDPASPLARGFSNSPLTREFGGKEFVWTDEFYHFLPTGPYSRDKLHVLLSVDTEKSDMTQWHVRPDNDYGVSWIKNYGKGRVFNCAIGHTPEFFMTPPLAQYILEAIQFILGDLEADTTPSARLSARKPK